MRKFRGEKGSTYLTICLRSDQLDLLVSMAGQHHRKPFDILGEIIEDYADDWLKTELDCRVRADRESLLKHAVSRYQAISSVNDLSEKYPLQRGDNFLIGISFAILIFLASVSVYLYFTA